MKSSKWYGRISSIACGCLLSSSMVVYSHDLSLSSSAAQVQPSIGAENHVLNLREQVVSQTKEINAIKQDLEQLKSKVSANDALIAYLSEEVMQIQAGKRVSSVGYPSSVKIKSSSSSNKNASDSSQSLMLKKSYDLMNSNKYSQAIIAFNDFLKKYPKSQDVDDVNYFLGELYLLDKKTDLAIQSFKKVSVKSNRAPDALVALGQLYLQNGDAYNAKKILDQVTKQYPNTDSAQRAKLLLSNM